MILPIETPYRTMSRAPLSAVVEFEMELNRCRVVCSRLPAYAGYGNSFLR